MPYDTTDRSAVACEDFGMHPEYTAKTNRQAMQNALTQGGLVTLMRGGAYQLDVDNFTVPDETLFAIGPGVSFSVDGVETLLSTVYCHRVASIPTETLGFQHTNSSKTDADTDESDPALYSLVIPAYTLGRNSTVEIDSLWTFPATGTKSLRIRFGGNVLLNLSITTNVALRHVFRFSNRNSLSSQIAQPNNSASFSTFASNAVQTYTIDFATDQTLTLTGQWGAAGSGSNSITLNSVIVKHWPGV